MLFSTSKEEEGGMHEWMDRPKGSSFPAAQKSFIQAISAVNHESLMMKREPVFRFLLLGFASLLSPLFSPFPGFCTCVRLDSLNEEWWWFFSIIHHPTEENRDERGHFDHRRAEDLNLNVDMQKVDLSWKGLWYGRYLPLSNAWERRRLLQARDFGKGHQLLWGEMREKEGEKGKKPKKGRSIFSPFCPIKEPC